ncbi:MAG: hypothetical protein IPH77_19300 [Ignavibacteria bacterium]|nr:hypothetical protein [Ignavibacteria bacterium]
MKVTSSNDGSARYIKFPAASFVNFVGVSVLIQVLYICEAILPRPVKRNQNKLITSAIKLQKNG